MASPGPRPAIPEAATIIACGILFQQAGNQGCFFRCAVKTFSNNSTTLKQRPAIFKSYTLLEGPRPIQKD